MPKIWRVEDSQGRGCYSGEKAWKLRFLFIKHCTDDKHPSPYMDSGIKRYANYPEQHGFKDRKQLLNWFTIKELKILKYHGFKLKRLEVQKITKIGLTQVLFIR